MKFVLKLKSGYKNIKGGVPVKVLFIFFSLIMIFLFIMEFMRVSFIASGIRDAINKSVIAVATVNADKTFDGFREASTYLSSEQLSSLVTESLFTSNISEQLGADNYANGVIKYSKDSNSEFEYRISNINISLENVSSTSKNYTLTFLTTAHLEIPLNTFGKFIIIPIDVKVKSYYTPKF